MTQQSISNKPYFENLDALRFFAFLSVFFSHCVGIFNYKFPFKYAELIHKHYFTNGDLGVSFFFVLSGFLISWLLFIEKTKTNTINIRNFYIRRILRIWPVYFLVVFVGFIIGINSNFPYHSDLSQLKWYLVFLANYDLIVNGVTNATTSVLWSVSIEEQFYAVWPLIFLIFYKKYFPYVCLLIILTSFAFRYNHTEIMRYSTFEVMSSLAVGGLFAYYSLTSLSFLNYVKNLSKKKISLIYVLLFLCITLKGFAHIFGQKIFLIYYPFESIIFSLFFSLIILEQNFSNNSIFKFGKIKLFSDLGKISYGLYAFHMFLLLIITYTAQAIGIPDDNFFGYIFKIISALILTVIFSKLSYNYYEKKILYYKKYFL